ncbi:Hypp7447 [Branchiostoma lanceolatum]|uniref:Hypp7447 protein n=1 Tax=Branchiostoma lanceolatum TaxID=7740 RepID=A0A8J9Z0B8_BRALA|nr:Hypp7447 [Branchiostoma lanceolatum]
MKFYVHREDTPQYTVVFSWEDQHEGTVGNLLQQFVQSYNLTFQGVNELDVEDVFVTKSQSSRQAISNEEQVSRVVRDQEDIFVMSKGPPAVIEPLQNVQSSPAGLEEDDNGNRESRASSEEASNVADKHSFSQTDDDIDLEDMRDLLEGDSPGGELRSSPQRRHSWEGSFDDVSIANLQIAQLKREQNKELNTGHDAQHVLIAKCVQNAQRLVDQKHCDKAVKIYEQVNRLFPHQKECLLGLASIYSSAGRPDKALEYLRTAVEAFPDHADLKCRLADCLLDLGQGKEASRLLYEAKNILEKKPDTKPNQLFDLQVQLAKAFILLGKHTMALQMCQAVVKEKKDHLEALLEYAELTYKMSSAHAKEALTIVMTLMVNKKDWMLPRDRLVNMMKYIPNGLKIMEGEIHEAIKSVPALVFLSNVFRDHGDVSNATQLLEHAMQVEPSHCTAFLSLIHMFEAQDRHVEAFKRIRTFLKQNPDMSIAGLKNKVFLPILKAVKEDIYLHATYPRVSGISADMQPPQQRAYNDQELNLLAVMFTLVKILFVKGALGLLPSFTKLLDPAHADRDLHTTLIRNEAAYYSTISQVMKIKLNPSSLENSPQFVYVAGDSHCITPAWRSIQYKGATHVLHPLLSTGTKIWHLRPEAKFFTKENFYNVMKKAPRKATVIFVFGEIDCREALPVCLAKCRYDSMEDTISRLLEIYTQALLGLKRKYKFTIYVHPVPPVLDLTRPTVMKFNTALKSTVEATSGLHWLDFVDELLCDHGTMLDSKFEFDGTHLHPCYVETLEKALSKAQERRTTSSPRK